MRLLSTQSELAPIHQRALALYVSKEYAQQVIGQGKFNEYQDSEQQNRRRELLAVEKAAQKEKIIAAHGEAHFRQQVTDKITEKVNRKLQLTLDNQQLLYSNVMQIEQAAPDILELLAVNAASLKRIIPLVKSLTWLANDLINLVNKPQYRKRADVQVHDAGLAVNYIGLDNLRLILPTFILKRWLPISTAPFPLMKRKLWNDGLSLALASQALAKHYQFNEYTAFTAAMLSNIGYLSVSRSFFAVYQDIHAKALKKAFESKDKRLHDMLLEIKAPAHILVENMMQQSYAISAQLVEQMNFDRLAITEIMFDIAYIEVFEKMQPISQLIIKARAYLDARALAKDGLINEAEIAQLYQGVQLSKDEITLLDKSDIDHLKLSFS